MSSSSASMNRACATPASVAARTTTRPSGRCQAVAVEPSASGAVPGAAAAHQAEAVRAGRGDDVLDHASLTRICAGRSAALPGTFARMRLVDAVSLRSRRRKLRLFLDEVRPDARDDGARRRGRRGRLRGRRRPVRAAARTTSSRSSIRGRRGSRRSGCTTAPASAAATPRSPTSRATPARCRSPTRRSTSSSRTP